MLGSYAYYINGQVEWARREGAPARAVFRRDNGEWVSIDDCVPQTREKIEAYVQERKARAHAS